MKINTVMLSIMLGVSLVAGNAQGAQAPREQIYDSVMDNQGRTIQVGRQGDSALIKRLDPAGNPDNSFGNRGKTTVDLGIPGTNFGKVRFGGEKIFAFGTAGNNVVIARVLDNGYLDQLFGRGRGLVEIPVEKPLTRVSEVFIRDGSRLVIIADTVGRGKLGLELTLMHDGVKDKRVVDSRELAEVIMNIPGLVLPGEIAKEISEFAL